MKSHPLNKKFEIKLNETVRVGNMDVFFERNKLHSEDVSIVTINIANQYNLETSEKIDEFLKSDDLESSSLYFREDGVFSSFNQYVVHFFDFNKSSEKASLMIEEIGKSKIVKVKKHSALIIAHAEAKKKDFKVEEVVEDGLFLDSGKWSVSLYGENKEYETGRFLNIEIDARTGKILMSEIS